MSKLKYILPLLLVIIFFNFHIINNKKSEHQLGSKGINSATDEKQDPNKLNYIRGSKPDEGNSNHESSNTAAVADEPLDTTPKPSNVPSRKVSSSPTSQPSENLTPIPSVSPTIKSTNIPSLDPTSSPTNRPSLEPSSKSEEAVEGEQGEVVTTDPNVNDESNTAANEQADTSEATPAEGESGEPNQAVEGEQGEVASNALIIPDKKSETDILVLIMGELSVLEGWFNRLKEVDANLFFIFASFDAQLPEDKMAIYMEDTSLPFKPLFIPDTTWTVGRNLLAAEALRLESTRGKEFTYWLFMDDDIEVNCEEEAKAIYGDGSCWQNVFNFMSSSKVPGNVSTIVTIDHQLNGFRSGFQAMSSADAFFAAFKREYIPYMLPYATLNEGYSHEVSQNALFCVMRTCLKSSAAIVPFIKFYNPKQKPFIRGMELDQIQQVIRDNYVSENFGLETCFSYSIGDFKQNMDLTPLVPIEKADTFNELIPPPELEKCEPMKARFEKWNNEVLQ